MEQTKKNAIRAIAREARKLTKALVTKHQDVYSDVDLESLDCGCAIGSTILLKLLHKNNIKAKLCINDWHAFVMVGDHVIDITATQFNTFRNNPVLILPLSAIEEKRGKKTSDCFEWKVEREFPSLRKWYASRPYRTWCSEQRPRKEHVDSIQP